MINVRRGRLTKSKRGWEDHIHLRLSRLASGLFTTALSLGLAQAMIAGGAPLPVGAVDNGLARTPYQGWNTFYGLGDNFNQATIQSVADALVSPGLRAAGSRYVWVDGGWGGG